MSVVVIKIIHLVGEQNTLRKKHLDEVDRNGEANAPVKELHDMPLSLNDLFPHWHDFRILSTFQISLYIIHEHKLVVYLIEFGRNQEASA